MPDKKNKKASGQNESATKAEEMRAWRQEMKEARKRKKLERRAESNLLHKEVQAKKKQSLQPTSTEEPLSGEKHTKKQKRKVRDGADAETIAPTKKHKADRDVVASASTTSEKGPMISDPEAYKVVVAGLPMHIDEARLRQDFSECGEVISVRLLKNRETGKSRGIAFISFINQSGLDSALAFDGEDYGGRALSVQIAKKIDGNKGMEEVKGKGKSKGKNVPGVKPLGCTSVIVKGLSYSVTEADLTKLFSSCGDGVKHINMLSDRDTGNFRGIAFVDFDSEVAVDEAIKLHGSELKGRRFSMDYAPPREKSSGPGEKPSGCTSIVVKGLSFNVTEDDLMEVFKSCGSGPLNVRLAIDKDTGQPRGIAFIDFVTGEAVDAAVGLHGTELKGRPFKVDYAGASKDNQSVVVKPGGKQKGPGQKPLGCTSIVVKGLTDAVTEKYLMKKFKACGTGPRNVNITVDKETGVPSGMAFVNFSEESAVDEAIKLHGTEMKGQTISVGYVKPKMR